MGNSPKILLIGPVADAPEKEGGATRSFAHLVDGLQTSEFDIRVLNSQSFKNKFSFLSSLSRLKKEAKWADIVFLNVSQNGIRYLAPTVARVAKKTKTKLVIRPFGGGLIDLYHTAGVLAKMRLQFALSHTDLLYLQTQNMMKQLSSVATNIQQLPTSRPLANPDWINTQKPFEQKFLFVGHVKKEKGIQQIEQAISELPNGYSIDVFGPITDPELGYLTTKDFYKGTLDPNTVQQTISQYDALLLPTFYAGEGYPGVVIEAYSVGVPAITTHWKSIPEIVEDGTTGFLVEPKSTKALLAALQNFPKSRQQELRENALAYFRNHFEANTVLKSIIADLQTLVA